MQTRDKLYGTSKLGYILIAPLHHARRKESILPPQIYIYRFKSFETKLNDQMRKEMFYKCQQYTFCGLEHKFQAIATINDAILTKNGDLYTWNDIM